MKKKEIVKLNMTKKEIKKLALQKIKEGKSRQETYEELRDETKNPVKEIAKIVRFIPPLESRKKYKIAQVLLLVIMVFTIAYKVYAGLPIIMEKGLFWLPLIIILPIIIIILTIEVAKYRGEIYILLAFLIFLELIRNARDFMVQSSFDPIILIDLAIAVILIGLGIFLHSKMNSKHQIVIEESVNQQGKSVLRNKVQFTD